MSSGEGRKDKRLSSDDLALWDGVTRSVRPLRKRAPRVETAEAEPAPKSPKRRAAAEPLPAPSLPPPPKKAPPPVAALDRKTRQKIARGRDAIDARIDLHGHTQAEAHDVLLRFLRRTQGKGGRVVLVITGKGGRNLGGRGKNDRGVLKRAVPMWLALPEFRDLVIGFDQAAIAHGGEGALYVRLRKASRDAS